MDSIISSSHHHDIEWSQEENKVFENALAELDHHSPNLFKQITLRVLGKTLSQIQKHYIDLNKDIQMINSGRVPLPNYGKVNTADATASTGDVAKKEAKRKRKRGITWTSEEHKLFLIGLEKYGKGDWKSISRYSVVTRTPTQVASHAQKHFLRLQNPRNNRRKSSTVTTVVATAPSPLQVMYETYTGIAATAPSPLLQVMSEPYSGIAAAATASSPLQGLSEPYTSNYHQNSSTTTTAAASAVPSSLQDMSKPYTSIDVASTTAPSPHEDMSDSYTIIDDQFLSTGFPDFPCFSDSSDVFR
ncbi:hypothetical protein LWI28_012761 [Acer negundo]|uniref:Uncharacterized protein n=1 Tax=Acer negundo TaxID=4023 RepID=A0AAD5IJK3_ACENE|nr:hypothetical protein LWI28_012761 [Acer negundo]